MLRTTTTFIFSAMALLGALLAPGPASAVGETCRGEVATIVSVPGALSAEGTEGRDVIVSTGGVVSGKGGDDLICVIGDRESWIDAGTGEDVVDTTGATGRTSTQLGAGRDGFLGGTGTDIVSTDGAVVSVGGAGAELDTVDTGPGRAAADFPEQDYVGTGSRGAVNEDVITVDHGFVVFRGTPGPGSSLTGSSDSTLQYDAGTFTASHIDAGTHVWAVDDRPVLRWSGFAGFSMTVHDGHQSFTFEGTAADEKFGLTSDYEGVATVDSTLDLDVRMRGGDDSVSISYRNLGHRGDAIVEGSLVQGGGGRDLLTVFTYGSVSVDLAHDRLRLADGAVDSTSTAAGFEDATVLAPDVRLGGDNSRNTLRADACTAQVKGRGGADRLTAFVTVIADKDPYELVGCAEGGLPGVRSARFSGGPGADVLVGSYGDDRLLGGRGSDVTRGGRGRDVCRAEKVRRCEVRR